MIALIQRVTQATVSVDGETVAAIGPGVLALVAAVPDDDAGRAIRLAERVLAYRIFADERGRMNRSVADIGGAVLAVPQFTLAADTRRGNRPGFSGACAPDRARELFDECVAACRPSRADQARRLWRRHAGLAGQRRPGHVLAE